MEQPKTNKKSKKIPTKDLAFIGVFVALLAALSQITIPLPLGIPLTMQTFAVALTGAVLGWKRGIVAIFIYMLLGAIGAPVFQGFNGGFQVIIGPTGGYILSFPILAFLAGLGSDLSKKFKDKNRLVTSFALLIVGLVLGSVLNLVIGSLQLGFVLSLSMQNAFLAGFVPFILPEFIKMTFVFLIAPKLRNYI